MTEIFTNGIGGQEYVILLTRIAVGMFFAISGYHKLFNSERHAGLKKTLEDDNIPLVEFNAWFVPAIEFSAGVLLMVGKWTVLSASLLAAILLVALVTDGSKRVAEFMPVDFADKVDDYLYISETIYLFVLLWFVTAGPGIFALDLL